MNRIVSAGTWMWIQAVLVKAAVVVGVVGVGVLLVGYSTLGKQAVGLGPLVLAVMLVLLSTSWALGKFRTDGMPYEARLASYLE